MTDIKNGDMPATSSMCCDAMGYVTHEPGMTKREMIAMHAMQGLLSDGSYAELYDIAEEWRKNVTEAAVEFTDALLKELDK